MTSQPLVAQSTFIRVVAVPMQVFRFTKRWPIIPAVIMFLIVFGAVFAPVIAPFEPQRVTCEQGTSPRFGWMVVIRRIGSVPIISAGTCTAVCCTGLEFRYS